MTIKKDYRNFIRQKVDKKWLNKNECLTVLGENFIDGYYIIIFAVDDRLEINWETCK